MHHPVTPFSQATALSKELREILESEGASALRLLKRTDDRDGTTKLLLANADGSAVEAVVMRYPRRTTVCISTQVGCSLGCSFCVTGSIKFRRNLTVAEIVDQVREARAILFEEGRLLHNVVFMGMGEPLLNLDAVLTPCASSKTPGGWASPSARCLSPPSASPRAYAVSQKRSHRSIWRSQFTPPTMRYARAWCLPIAATH